MVPDFGYIIEDVASKKTFAEKVEELSKHKEDKQFVQFLSFVYDPTISFKVKKFPKDFRKLDPKEHRDLAPAKLRYHMRYVPNYIEGVGRWEEVTAEKQVSYLLEGLHESEVVLLKSMIEKKPIKGISDKVVREVFPELLPEVEKSNAKK